jgi:hypothetical protein
MVICLRDNFNVGILIFYLDVNKSGYNLIMTKKFVFISPIDKPYYVHDTIEIYNSIFSFIGLVHLPDFK